MSARYSRTHSHAARLLQKQRISSTTVTTRCTVSAQSIAAGSGVQFTDHRIRSLDPTDALEEPTTPEGPAALPILTIKLSK